MVLKGKIVGFLSLAEAVWSFWSALAARNINTPKKLMGFETDPFFIASGYSFLGAMGLAVFAWLNWEIILRVYGKQPSIKFRAMHDRFRRLAAVLSVCEDPEYKMAITFKEQEIIVDDTLKLLLDMQAIGFDITQLNQYVLDNKVSSGLTDYMIQMAGYALEGKYKEALMHQT